MKSVKNVFLMLGLVVVSTMMFASPKNNIINSEGKQIHDCSRQRHQSEYFFPGEWSE
jgi:hypothetical protein